MPQTVVIGADFTPPDVPDHLKLGTALPTDLHLESCRKKFAGNQTIDIKEPGDHSLKHFEGNEEFMNQLKTLTNQKQSNLKDVVKCLGGLYHHAPMKRRGIDLDIVIDAHCIGQLRASSLGCAIQILAPFL